MTKFFNTALSFLFLGLLFNQCENTKNKPTQEEFLTVCNPMNLSYRFMPDGVSRREAADPTVILFKDTYYLFASKSGGYWYSDDLITWDFIETNEIPTEEYAPTAVVLNDEVYFLASNHIKNTVYKSSDPKSGKWQVAKEALEVTMVDPAFYLDDDNNLYLYWGCSNKLPIYGVEIDKVTFDFIGETMELIHQNPTDYGWEVRGDYNTVTDDFPWLEGAWMNKYNDKYYLQYAAPGTEDKSYCDGVYESDSPLGPFELAEHNSFASKPEGFACGAGHGSTFKDKHGNYWHVGTITVSVKDKFERRIGFYPVFFDQDGVFYSDTQFGDFPFKIPQKKIENFNELFPGWMLLSFDRPVEVSSEYPGRLKEMATDEDIRTYWSAQTGEKGEWFQMDLEKEDVINAIQVNFAENETTLYERNLGIFHQYLVEYSLDKKVWKTLIDKTQNSSDEPHDFTQLKEPVKARFLRITNYRIPSGTFALADFRVFGHAQGDAPQNDQVLTVSRNNKDRRQVRLNWNEDENAVGYNIRYGSNPEKLYHTYQVLKRDTLTIRSLNTKQKYYFSIDSFNENGIKQGSQVVTVD
ncbi:MAG: family 43 glycosylhydrolase [Lutimonas sp.]